MLYMNGSQPEPDEVFYCHCCGRTYEPVKKHETCCGYLTASYHKESEKLSQAICAWRALNPMAAYDLAVTRTENLCD